jgi:hypothetical protein
MASKSYEEYLNSVKLTKMSRFNLPKPDHEESIAEAVAEGFKLLEEEEKGKSKAKASDILGYDPNSDKKRLETKLASTSDNPYIRARIQILNKMTPTARAIIEKMENGKLEKDSRYDAFVKAVEILGDQLSA